MDALGIVTPETLGGALPCPQRCQQNAKSPRHSAPPVPCAESSLSGRIPVLAYSTGATPQPHRSLSSCLQGHRTYLAQALSAAPTRYSVPAGGRADGLLSFQCPLFPHAIEACRLSLNSNHNNYARRNAPLRVITSPRTCCCFLAWSVARAALP